MIAKRIVNFLRFNGEKKMTLSVYWYVGFYRLCLQILPMSRIETMMGIRGEESQLDTDSRDVCLIRLVAFHVNRVTQHLPLKRKCFVRALTARRILMKHGINSTLYMGVALDHDSMIAHAWLRSGSLYVTGGNGDGYSTVARFRAF